MMIYQTHSSTEPPPPPPSFLEDFADGLSIVSHFFLICCPSPDRQYQPRGAWIFQPSEAEISFQLGERKTPKSVIVWLYVKVASIIIIPFVFLFVAGGEALLSVVRERIKFDAKVKEIQEDIRDKSILQIILRI